MEKSFLHILILGILIWFGSVAPRAQGEKPPSAAQRQAEQRAECQQRLRELDSPYYETRCMAAERVEGWLAMPEMAAMLTEQFQQLVVQPELPYEVRWRISSWRSRLPLVTSEPPQSVSAEEIERLVRQLDDNSYAVRVGASERLRWMAASEHLAKPIMQVIKHRLTDPALSEEMYRRVESIRNIAWGNWVTGDASDWNLPPVSDRQINDWLEALGEPVTGRDPHSAIRRRIARQELLDVLSQDREVPRVKAAIEARLRKADAATAAGWRALLDLTRPALVAEIWSSGEPIVEQHMVVGQPMYSPGAPHPSYFDRADDRVAHCVEGNSLLPGKYPVGVAFPAPNWHSERQAVFHLVNLPTPRRQIAYSYYVKTNPADRLAKLSRRTLDRLLAEKRLLSDSELGMLGQLDAHEVSRFASRYFLELEKDGTVGEDFNQEASTSRNHLGSQNSCFGAICGQLALNGTREAVPGLLEAIRQRKFISPTPLGPYRLEWLAALSIAGRDPWPDVDSWLAENTDNQQTLLIDHLEAAEIGATAAGVLLTRHGERPEAFGLQATVDSQLVDVKLTGFRYSAPEDVQRVRQWWKRQAETHKTNASAPIFRP